MSWSTCFLKLYYSSTLKSTQLRYSFRVVTVKRYSPLVGCRLTFSYFVGSRLKFSVVGNSQLISKNACWLLIVVMYFTLSFKTFILIKRKNASYHCTLKISWTLDCFCNMIVYFTFVCQYSPVKITKAFIVNESLVSLLVTGHRKK